jgi:predicted negative regulator of RcsB-dependent stress response
MRIQPADRFWIGIYRFTAFILAIAVGVFAWLAWQSHQEAGAGRTANARPQESGPVPEERFQLLAAFQAPAYARTSSEPGPFEKAMEHYTRGDYSGAAAGLRAVAAAQPSYIPARFYLGI